MKMAPKICSAATLVMLVSACNIHRQKCFVSERISRTASITATGNIDIVFPLFGAFEERKLDHNWTPILVYPDKEIIEEGTTFKTIQSKHHAHRFEKEFLWRIIKFLPEEKLIQYLVSTPNRQWTVTVICTPINNGQTKVTVTYCYTGLNERGNKLNKHALNTMYKNDLKDWEGGINFFLEHGKAINAPN
jgi:hypothetical protein